MNLRSIFLKTLGAAALGFALAASAGAQTYPQRPIRLIVTFGPGSGADTIGRILGERLSEQLKTAVVVENREGAGGAIGAAVAARAPADGYTLMLGATTMTVSPYMQTAPQYDPVKDFVPIIKVAELPLMMIAGEGAPYKNLKELVDYARANPGKLTYATSGKGSPSHLGIELIRQATHIDVRDVPYKNVGQAMTDTLSGQVSFYFPAVTGALAQVTAGKARGLAIGATQRSSQAPEVATVAEQLGISGLEVITWYGLFAPQGTPKEIVDRLYAETAKIMESEEVRGRIRKTGADVALAAPQAFAAQVRADTEKYSKLVRDLGLKE
jgi:tripartite-type tricarboxylate transporter receptor subunit TctC